MIKKHVEKRKVENDNEKVERREHWKQNGGKQWWKEEVNSAVEWEYWKIKGDKRGGEKESQSAKKRQKRRRICG